MWSQRVMTWEQEVEQKRRHRAELRQTYGNLVSSINISIMRHKQKALEAQAQALESAAANKQAGRGAAEKPPEENSLRRIASSFAHVSDLQTGNYDALPPDDSEQDAKEERAEVLISSQTMPLPPPVEESTLPTQPTVSTAPVVNPLELPSARLLPYELHLDSRAKQRWQRLGMTVSALFRARRQIDSNESPMAQTRRLREQRELLETFTRPFLYEPSRRDYAEIGVQKSAEDQPNASPIFPPN